MPRKTLALLFLVLTALVSPAVAANTHGTQSEGQERAAWFGDMLRPHIVSGCVPAVPIASLVTGSVACRAYVRGSTGALVYVDQALKAIGPLAGGDGTYWLALHRDTSSAVTSWTREPQTHYIWIKSASVPTMPADTLLVAELTVSSNVLTAISLRADTTAVPGVTAVTVYTSTFVPVYGMTFAAIQAAIDALPLTGGQVIVEPGTYTGAATITLGNGGVGVGSTRNNILVRGLTPGNYDKGKAATILQWTGGSDPVVAVRGPLIGWGVQNVYIDGGGTASAGVYVVSGQYGEVRDIVVAGQKGNGIWSTCVPTFAGWNGVTDSLKNMWHNVWVWHLPPAEPNTAGIALDSTDISCNTDFNQFYQPTVVVAGVAGYGLFLGGADHNMFYNAHFIDDPTALSDIHFAYDNAGFSGWPCANHFYGLGLNNEGMSSSGTPLADNTCNNSIFGFSGGDPADYVPDLPGVTVVFGRKTNQNLVLIAGRSSASAQPVGNVELFTSLTYPRHFVPTVDGLADLGLASTARFRDIYLLGQVIKLRRAVSGDGVQNAQQDYYVQITNSAPSSYALQTAAAPYGCGREYVLKNLGGFNVTVAPFGAETIDGNPTLTLTPAAGSSAVRLFSDCVGWHVIGRD